MWEAVNQQISFENSPCISQLKCISKYIFAWHYGKYTTFSHFLQCGQWTKVAIRSTDAIIDHAKAPFTVSPTYPRIAITICKCHNRIRAHIVKTPGSSSLLCSGQWTMFWTCPDSNGRRRYSPTDPPGSTACYWRRPPPRPTRCLTCGASRWRARTPGLPRGHFLALWFASMLRGTSRARAASGKSNHGSGLRSKTAPWILSGQLCGVSRLMDTRQRLIKYWNNVCDVCPIS